LSKAGIYPEENIAIATRLRAETEIIAVLKRFLDRRCASGIMKGMHKKVAMATIVATMCSAGAS